MTDFTYSSQHASTGPSTLTMVWATITAMANSAAETLSEWQHNYHSRRELAMLSHSERSDIGYASEIDTEIEKPFWKK